MARTAAGTCLVLALTLAISAAVAGGSTQPAAAAELPAFTDCAKFTAHMRAIAEPEVTAYGFGGGPMYKGGPIAEGGAPAPAADSESRSAPGEAVGNGPTGTNVQERGVDEPDVAKIDGDRVLSLVDGRLTVVDASRDKPRVSGELTFPEGQYPSELLVLDDDRALVFGTAFDAEPAAKVAPDFAPDGPSSTPKVVLTLVELSDGGDPRILRTEKVTGSYVSARLHDGVARVVLTSQPRIAFTYPREGEPEALALARNKAAVRDADAADWLPAREILDARGGVLAAGPLMDCAAVRHPIVASGLGIISVLTLDTRAGADAFERGRAAGVVSNGELVYSSADRLYVATTDGGWNFPRPIDAGSAGSRPADDEQRTRIHAFDVTGRDDSPYVASGAVPGYLLGRWALSEHEGVLRVATTSGPPWAMEDGPVSQSSVIVLAERGDDLREIGRVDGLGKTERIRAVRWFDDLAAIVTFRQTDPLYLVDISDPARPRVRGELKIPGYSAYLHPVGGDVLLGVGQDADAEGRVTGLQISSFDIADVTRPTRADAVGLGQGYTDVENDSRAFTYLPSRRLAIVPAWVTQNVECPPDAQCTAAPGGPVGPDGGAEPGFVGQIQVPAAVAIEVGPDGELRKRGKFIGESAVLRVLPVGGRLAAVTATSIVLLDPDGLKVLGTARTARPAPAQPTPQPFGVVTASPAA